MSLHEDLVATRDLIATPDKWCKGQAMDYGGAMCLAGALWTACGLDQNEDWRAGSPRYERYNKAAAEIRKLIPSHFIPDWNDCFERTHEEVLAVLDIAIEASAPPKSEYLMPEFYEKVPGSPQDATPILEVA